ncbi:hypothetical protein ACFLWA_04655 [Chloroflexota bacterium]
MRTAISTPALSFLAVLALVSLLALVACGASDEPTSVPDGAEEPELVEAVVPAPTARPTLAPTSAPTKVPEPTAAAPVVEELDLAGLSLPSGLDSYRATMQVLMEGTGNGDEISGRVDLLTEYTREPLAQYVRISGEGTEGFETSTVELFREQDTAYMNLDGEWLALTVSDSGDDLLEDAGIIGPNDVLTDTCGWKKGQASELGILSIEYWSLSKESMDECMPATELDRLGALSEVSGDLYVATDGHYVVKMDLVFVGKDLDIGMDPGEELPVEGRIEFHFEITDVNQPHSIRVPDKALASGGTPDDIPVSRDAEAVNNVFGVITYVSPTAVGELAEFYKVELPKKGWTQVSTEEFGGVYMLEYSKADRTASVMIEADDETDKTSVLISIREGDE